LNVGLVGLLKSKRPKYSVLGVPGFEMGVGDGDEGDEGILVEELLAPEKGALTLRP
jgi:hypothetical protein